MRNLFFSVLVGAVIASTTIAPVAHADSTEKAGVCLDKGIGPSRVLNCFPEWVAVTIIDNPDGSSVSRASDAVFCLVGGCFTLVRDTRRPGVDVVSAPPVGTQTALPNTVLVCQPSTKYCLPYIEVSTTCDSSGRCISKAPDLLVSLPVQGRYLYSTFVLDTGHDGLDVVPWVEH